MTTRSDAANPSHFDTELRCMPTPLAVLDAPESPPVFVSPVILGEIDHDWRFSAITADAIELLGWDRDEHRGTPLLATVHPDDAPALLLALGRSSADHRGMATPVRVRSRDGGWAPVRCAVSPLCEHNPPRFAVAIWSSTADVAGPRDRMDGLLAGGVWSAWEDAQLVGAHDGPAAAFELLAGIYDDPPALRALLAEDPAAAPWMARTALAVGDHQRAAAVVDAAEQLAVARPGVPALAASVQHARGLLDQDAAALLRAASQHREPWARASAAEDAGVVLVAAGDHGAAVTAFEKALATYQQAGAEGDVRRVRSRLRRLGVRRRHWRTAPRPVYGWASLTDTERSVAEHVAEGLTNRQVADRMFLSPHTIDFHLRQIFRKLDISSRVELTRVELTRLVLTHHDEERRPAERDECDGTKRALAGSRA